MRDSPLSRPSPTQVTRRAESSRYVSRARLPRRAASPAASTGGGAGGVRGGRLQRGVHSVQWAFSGAPSAGRPGCSWGRAWPCAVLGLPALDWRRKEFKGKSKREQKPVSVGRDKRAGTRYWEGGLHAGELRQAHSWGVPAARPFLGFTRPHRPGCF